MQSRSFSHPWVMTGFGIVWYYWVMAILYPGEVGTGFGTTLSRALALLFTIVGFIICISIRRVSKWKNLAMPLFAIAALLRSIETAFAFFGGMFFAIPDAMQIVSTVLAVSNGICLFGFFDLLASYHLKEMRFSIVSSIAFGLLLYLICSIVVSISSIAFGIIETSFGIISIPLFWYARKRVPHASNRPEELINRSALAKSAVRISSVMIAFGILIGISELGFGSSNLPYFGVFLPLFAIIALVCCMLFLRRHTKTSDILQCGKVSIVVGSLGVILQLLSSDYSGASSLVIFVSYVCFFVSMMIFYVSLIHYQTEMSISVLLSIAMAADSGGLAIGFLLHSYFATIDNSVYSVLLFAIAAVFIIAGAFLLNKQMLFPLQGASKALEIEARDTHLICVQMAEEFGLTPRQREVFYMLASGKRADAIADELVLSLGTIRTHINQIYEKMGVHSHNELMALVHETPIKNS